MWKARHSMNQLRHIFETSRATMNTRAQTNERLSSSVPGHPEAASCILANLWNILDLRQAKSVTAAKSLAKSHFKSTWKCLIWHILVNLSNHIYLLVYLFITLVLHLNKSMWLSNFTQKIYPDTHTHTHCFLNFAVSIYANLVSSLLPVWQ